MTGSLEATLRVEGGRVLATLVRMTGDFDLAEDALADAVVTAVESWPERGVPDNPAAWLTTVARNKALDRIRRASVRTTKERDAVTLLDDHIEPADGRDDRLRLLFTSCHPALSPESRVALALRTIGGLTTSEIAHAFLVPEPTMGQRISRAKRKIKTARIPYRIPEEHEWPDRLPAVLTSVYVIFTTGHHAPSGEARGRVDLAEEGVRLAGLLAELMPDEPECLGLAALTLAVHARRGTHVDESGGLVLLADQDRTRWDRGAIAEAEALLDRAMRRNAPGPFQIEAAIACLHDAAPTFDDTDWEEIAALYRRLQEMKPGPVVAVNRAVAEGMVGGPEAGLALLDAIDGADGWHLAWATRSELLRRSGRIDEAVRALDRALELPMNDADRRLLERRRLGIRASAGGVQRSSSRTSSASAPGSTSSE